MRLLLRGQTVDSIPSSRFFLFSATRSRAKLNRSSGAAHTSGPVYHTRPRFSHGPASFFTSSEKITKHFHHTTFIPFLSIFPPPSSSFLPFLSSIRRVISKIFRAASINEAKTFHLHAHLGVEKPVNANPTVSLFLSFLFLPLQDTRITLARYRYHRFIPVLSPYFGGGRAKDKLITGHRIIDHSWRFRFANLIAG